MDFIIGHHLLCDHVCIVVHVCMQYGVCNVNIAGSIQYHVYIIYAKQYVTGFAKRYLFHTFDIPASKMS